MTILDDSEIEDFKQAIKNTGFDPDDFEVTQHPHSNEGEDIYAITGEVTIIRKSSGLQKSYRAGHGSRWPAEFNDDLAKGVFG